MLTDYRLLMMTYPAGGLKFGLSEGATAPDNFGSIPS